jgi:hypothetical protein
MPAEEPKAQTLTKQATTHQPQQLPSPFLQNCCASSISFSNFQHRFPFLTCAKQ